MFCLISENEPACFNVPILQVYKTLLRVISQEVERNRKTNGKEINYINYVEMNKSKPLLCLSFFTL